MLAATFVVSALSACSLFPTAPPEHVSLHLLDVRPAVATAVRLDRVLAISPVRAAPGVESTAIAYVSNEHGLEHFATHRWADTPARMLDPLLIRALDDTDRFRSVVQSRTGVQADLRLDTEIIRLRQSFLTRPGRIELSLRAQLIDIPGKRVLATRYLELEEEVTSNDAAGGVAATNIALGSALKQLAAFCVDASAAAPTRGAQARGTGAAAAAP